MRNESIKKVNEKGLCMYVCLNFGNWKLFIPHREIMYVYMF